MKGQGIDSIIPIGNIGEEQYTVIWQKLFATIFVGFWGRAIFVALLVMALFFGIRRRNPRAAMSCVFVAAAVAFGAGILNWVSKF